MNYLIIPFLVLLLLSFERYLRQRTFVVRLRENTCVRWCITLLFSLPGGIISYHIYGYEFTAPLSPGLITILLLYLILALLFIALSPSGYRRLFGRVSLSEEQYLYAEYRFNHSLELLKQFFYLLLFLIPPLFGGYEYLRTKYPLPALLEEVYLIGGLYFVAFCILCPISLRQSIFWLRQLQRLPQPYETGLLKQEQQRLQYYRKNRKI